MSNEDLNKTFFNPGDIVILKHQSIISPVMYVVEKVTAKYKQNDTVASMFKGIKCRWFDRNLVLHEAIFSSKDLKSYKPDCDAKNIYI